MTEGTGVAHRSHLSIGEVLSLLQEEFPDVTISKIRFLESQGLLDPERTPSGYRKFYEPDLQRLRWILRQQKDHFLPLKVIKDRLEESDRSGIPLEAPEPIGTPSSLDEQAEQAERSEGDDTVPVATTRTPAHAAPLRADPATRGGFGVGVEADGDDGADPPAAGRGAGLGSMPTSVSLTRHELAAMIDVSDDDVADLERYGLITGQVVGRETIFDGDDVVVARAAASFLRYGVEARHLRMYKVAAEREAGFVEQIVMPMVKQHNATARQQARETVEDLGRLGEGLRSALLRHLLGKLAEPG
jgi:DNA-binding transcriptional MerR regulator